MIAYSLILSSVPQIFHLQGMWLGKFWTLWWAFLKASLPRCPRCRAVWFCLASLDRLTNAKGFSLLWPGKSCSSNPWAAFWGELLSLLVWDQRNGTCGRGVTPFRPHTLGSWAGETKHTQSLQISYFLCPGEVLTPESHQIIICCLNCCVKLLFAWGFCLREMLAPSCTMCWSWAGIFPGILDFCSGVRRMEGDGEKGLTVSYLSIIYFSFSSCLVDILLVNKLLGFFSRFHSLVFISYEWKGLEPLLLEPF